MENNKQIIITDSTHSVETTNSDIVKKWQGKFLIICKDNKILDVTENVIYFKYAYMHSWFGYYFSLSCLFSNEFINTNKEILENQLMCKVTFTDIKGTFQITGKPSNKTILSKQIPNTKDGNTQIGQWTCIYYSDILVGLDKEPTITNSSYALSQESVKKLLRDNNISNEIYFTSSFSQKADDIMYKSQNSTVKNKNLREALLNIISNLKINDSTVASLSLTSNIKNKHEKNVICSIDDGLLYPFRIGVDTSGNKLFVSYYKDMLKNVNNTCTFLCSFTDGGLNNQCMGNASNIKGTKVYMSSPIKYSLENDYTNYIYSSNKCSLEIDYSHQSTKKTIKYNLQNILNMGKFYQPSNYISNSNNESKTFKYTASYSDRQKCASILFNSFYANSKYIFRNEEGLIPTTFFTFNNGNVLWSLSNLYHIAVVNKVLKNSGVESIHLPSQINGFIIEIESYTGKPGLLTMVQYISLSRPAIFPNI